jgi:hypothetical protein
MRPTLREASHRFRRVRAALATLLEPTALPATTALPTRAVLLTCAALLTLAACGSSSMGSMSGTSPAVEGAPPGSGQSGNPDPIATGGGVSGSQNTIIATASSGPIAVAAGARRTIAVTFTSSDGSPISGFGVTSALAGLPAGWSAPANFTCAAVDSGSNCVLDLEYAPTVAGNGTLTLDCVYIDNASMPTTPGVCLTLGYSATVGNNVVAAATPVGQVNAVVGAGARSVSVNFVTDDGNAATGLAVTTDLTALPAGWSSAAPALACAIVSTGSGCQLLLQFQPTASSGGTLTLAYGYDDAAGAAKTGTLNIPYSSRARGTVSASAAPSGEVIAIQKTGGQPVAVTFTTDDGHTASDLFLTSSLVGMPAGWSAASKTFTCAMVGTGNGCQLELRYAPTALGSGTLALRYAYTDSGGGSRTGLLNLAYTATTDDNVAATAAPWDRSTRSSVPARRIFPSRSPPTMHARQPPSSSPPASRRCRPGGAARRAPSPAARWPPAAHASSTSSTNRRRRRAGPCRLAIPI